MLTYNCSHSRDRHVQHQALYSVHNANIRLSLSKLCTGKFEIKRAVQMGTFPTVQNQYAK